MSVAYYIVIDNEEPGFETFVNGKAVAHAIEELDALSAKEGLGKLEDFMGQSADELADMLDEDIDLPEGSEENLWFEPDDGIALVDALSAKIQANPESLSEPDDVLSDLAEYKDVLLQAKNINAKWHLALDI
jgi:hypothetical protein